MSDISYLVSSLASKVKSPTAHQVLFQTAQEYYLICLAKNPNLSPELLDQLVRSKLPHRDFIKNLAARTTPLEDEQVLFLLSNSRPSDLKDLLYTSLVPRASYELQSKLLDQLGKVTPKLATLWLSNRQTLKAIQPRLVELIIPPELLAHLTPDSDVTDAEVLKALQLLEIDDKILRYYLWPLFDARPSLITPALALHNGCLDEALASSRHIFDQKVFEELIARTSAVIAKPLKTEQQRDDRFHSQKTLVAIAANPNASLATSTSALNRRTMGADLISYGGSRSKPTTWGHLSYRFGSEGYAVVLKISKLIKSQKKQVTTTSWEHLSKKELSTLLQDRYLPAPAGLIYPTLHKLAVGDKSSSISTALAPRPKYDTTSFTRVTAYGGYDMSPARLKELIESPLDALGSEGWEIFISGALDWSGSLPALLDTVRLLTTQG